MDAREVDQLVAQVAAADKLDAAAREQLAGDLRQTDPSLWPFFVQQFRATLALRRAKEAKDRAAASVAAVGSAKPGPSSARSAADGDSRERATFGFGATSVGPLARTSPAETPARSRRPTGEAGPAQAAYVETADRRNEAGDETAVGPVRTGSQRTAAARDSQEGGNWQERLSTTIAALEAELHDAPQSAAAADMHARLRMLYLLADRREDALRPIPSAPPAVQEFWSQELYGLATWLDSRRVGDPSRRAGESKPALAGAADRLGQLGPLVVRNVAFITEVQSYGVYKPFPKAEFTPGQELLLYAEVEGFKSEDTPKGFQTALQASYQVFDSRGGRVASQDLNTVEETCRNPRRDFFLAYHLSLPKRILRRQAHPPTHAGGSEEPKNRPGDDRI